MSTEVAPAQLGYPKVSQASPAAFDLGATLCSVLDVAHGLLAADAYAVWLLDRAEQRWRVLQSRGLSDAFRQETIEALDPELPPTMVCAEDVSSNSFLAQRADWYLSEGIQSLLIVPLTIRGHWQGTIVFYYRQQHRFSDSEVQHANALATLASSALETAHLYEEQSLSKAHSDFLSQASATLASSLDYQKTLEALAWIAVPHIADFCAVDMMVDGRLQRLALARADHAKAESIRKTHLGDPLQVTPDFGIGRVLATGESQLYHEITEDSSRRRAADEQHSAMLRSLGLRSALLVGLTVRDEVLGVMTLATGESQRRLTQSDLELAEEVARRAAVAIDNARLFTASQKSEQKFRAVSATASCAIFVHNGRNLLYANEQACKLGGFSAGDFSSFDMWQLVHPDDRDSVQQRVLERMGGEEIPGRHEFRLLRPDGSVTWLNTSSSVIEFDGHPALMVTGFDITDQKKLYEQLQRREQEARVLLDTLPDIISRFDRDLRYLYISPHVERLSGIPAGQFIGKTFTDLEYPSDLCKLWTASLRQLLETKQPVHIEFSVPDREGHIHHFLGTGVPEITRDGQVESVVTISHDVTEQVNSADLVRESRAQMRIIIDSMPGLVAYVDREERFVRVNRTFEKWFGAPLKTFLGKTIREVLGEHNYEHLRDHIHQALQGATVQYEATNLYHDAERHVLITYTPDFDDVQQVRGFVALVMDVTDSYRAQETLRKTEKLAAAGRLAASIAHEINNPLESVTNLLYLLRGEPGLSESGQRYLTMADTELERVSQIATQTLRFHRQSTHPATANINDVVDAVIGLYERRFATASVSLVKQYGACEPVEMLEGEVRQLLANIIGNALDATAPGGQVIVRTRQTRYREARGLIVTVADTGHGISRELLPRIFEPFVTTKPNTGTGLGLWVTKEIVSKHKGFIRVRSRTGPVRSGTVFRIFLADMTGEPTTAVAAG